MTSYPPPGQYPPPPPYRQAQPYPQAQAYPQGEPYQLSEPAFLQGQPGHPADPPRIMPPPPNHPAPPLVVPPVAWLLPLAAVLAVIGVFTPWFDPTGVYRGQQILQSSGGLYSWKDGKIGLLAPILLVGLAVNVVSLLRGKPRGRFVGGPDPVRSVAKFALGVAVAVIVCAGIAWFLLPGQYHFTFSGMRYSWNDLQNRGVSLDRGPRAGYYLTIAAAVLALLGGAAMLLTSKPVTVVPSLAYGPPPGQGVPGHGVPGQSFPPAGQGFPGQGFAAPGFPGQGVAPPAQPDSARRAEPPAEAPTSAPTPQWWAQPSPSSDAPTSLQKPPTDR